MEFRTIAPFLTHPLVVVGYVLLLFFGLLRALLKEKIIPPLTPQTGGRVVQVLLKYGFVIALVTILLGFLIEGYRMYLRTSGDVASKPGLFVRITDISNVRFDTGFVVLPGGTIKGIVSDNKAHVFV